MIRFPIFEQLDVDGYGMFPGTTSTPGLHVHFDPGLTLVLGANGLGKTTLVTLLYRMCTGPYEIPRLAAGAPLGTRSLDVTRLQPAERRVLASRVVDDGANATARLQFSLGDDRVEVLRSLKTLAVTALSHNGVAIQPTDDRFQELITHLTGLPAFGDWILILRYLVFYFEDRSALVWDPTAQRQVLRVLLLPTSTAAAWAAKEREVLELDSRVRNLRNTLNREEGVHQVAQVKVRARANIVDELGKTEEQLALDAALLESITDQLPDLEANRQRARLRALTTEQERDSAQRALERLQLRRIAAAFPNHDETAKYLMSRLLSTDVCQTCGTQVPEFAASLEDRIKRSQCVVCGSPLVTSTKQGARLERELRRIATDLDALDVALKVAADLRDQAEAAYDASLSEYQQLASKVAEQRSLAAALVRRLPPDEQTLHAQSTEISSLRGRLELLALELDQRRTEFDASVRGDMATIARQRGRVIERFQSFAEGFLFESCRLRWAPHSARVGQTGPTVEFPAFEFEMSGSDFPTPVRRSGPEQVSESQREFVDLAFRMTLIAIAGEHGVGSMVIDAPESSLDAVFSERAARVLVRFADPKLANRLVVTSNLVDGQLIPELLHDADITSPESSRVVDLLELATPTSAIRLLAGEYRDVRNRIFAASAKQ
ncbi:MAG: AAA family ATPase [Gaiellaceae bacterium]